MNKLLKVIFSKLLIFICLLSIDGCVTSSLVKTNAELAGFQSQIIKTKNFDLFSFVKNEDINTRTMVVYIEGDGHAWKRRKVLSSDPTPKNPLSLKLATNDPRSLILYLARPCQNLEKLKLETCSSKYWSSHRYAKKVIESMNEAITKMKSQTNATSLEIIGFSGGGVVAMLIAAQRGDVSKVITVAANIDHDSWSDWHGVSKLSGSLTPLDYLTELEGINQQHYWGSKDKIVPYETQSFFVENFENNALFQYKIIPDFDHDCCWLEQWSDLLSP